MVDPKYAKEIENVDESEMLDYIKYWINKPRSCYLDEPLG